LDTDNYLIGDYTIIFDGQEEFVTFMDEDGCSYVSTYNCAIETGKEDGQCNLIIWTWDGDHSLIIK
jgi:hypothetical protein